MPRATSGRTESCRPRLSDSDFNRVVAETQRPREGAAKGAPRKAKKPRPRAGPRAALSDVPPNRGGAADGSWVRARRSGANPAPHGGCERAGQWRRLNRRPHNDENTPPRAAAGPRRPRRGARYPVRRRTARGGLWHAACARRESPQPCDELVRGRPRRAPRPTGSPIMNGARHAPDRLRTTAGEPPLTSPVASPLACAALAYPPRSPPKRASRLQRRPHR